ncbi:hypothetical protein SMICM304S_05841 [Streptomyces microflavus]
MADDRSLPVPSGGSYFAERVEPELALYNIVAAWELAGSLESRLLEKALVHVTRRHESLRTAFETVDGVPRSRLVDAPAVPLDRVDLRDREAGEAESVLRETLDRELAHKYRPGSGAAGPLHAGESACGEGRPGRLAPPHRVRRLVSRASSCVTW